MIKIRTASALVGAVAAVTIGGAAFAAGGNPSPGPSASRGTVEMLPNGDVVPSANDNPSPDNSAPASPSPSAPSPSASSPSASSPSAGSTSITDDDRGGNGDDDANDDHGRHGSDDQSDDDSGSHGSDD